MHSFMEDLHTPWRLRVSKSSRKDPLSFLCTPAELHSGLYGQGLHSPNSCYSAKLVLEDRLIYHRVSVCLTPSTPRLFPI